MNTLDAPLKRTKSIYFIILTLLAVCLFAIGAIFVNLTPLPPIATAFYRVLFSIPLLFPFVYKEFKQLSKSSIILMLLAGLFFGGDLTFWNISLRLTTVANSNLFATLVPITIIPCSYLFFKEKISKSFFIGTLITLFGVFILLSGKIHPTESTTLGNIFAFLASIFYGIFMLLVYKIRDRVRADIIMFFSGISTSILLFFIMLIFEGISYPHTISAVLPILCITIFAQILGQSLLGYCLGKIHVTLASVLVLFQPVTAALMAYFIFKQYLSVFEIIGLFIVLVGIFFSKK